MELLQEFFLYDPESIKRAITGSADLSLTKSILFGTGAFIVAFVFYAMIWIVIEGSIISIGYPREMTLQDEKEYRRSTSLMDRIFLTRLRREAMKKRVVVWFYWLLSVINWICVLLSIVIWVGTIVLRRSQLALLGLELPVNAFFFHGIITFVPSFLFDPSERELYRWNKKKK